MQQALQLRAEGATYRDVAGQLGISETTARELIHEAIAEVNATNHRLAEDMIYEVTAGWRWLCKCHIPQSYSRGCLCY
jgi:orotate phosphoribosyltransferase-like protein